MAAREPTALEQLREVGRYIDYSLQPSHNELPAVLAALIYSSDLGEKIVELRKDGLTDAQISYEVAHIIAPPDPDAGATIVQGVPPEQHQALLDEVAQLRAAVQEMRGTPAASAPTAGPAAAVAPVTPGQTTGNAPPVATPATLTAEQQELQALREEVQSMRIAQASGQHPTGASEPVPASEPGPESGGGTAPPADPAPPAEAAPPSSGQAE